MSVSYVISLSKSGGISSSIIKQIKSGTLKPVKKIVIKYDPFHENTASIRDFSLHLTSKRFRNTNPKCIIKTEIASDRCEPTVNFDTIDGQKFIFKTENLTCEEILKSYNKYITPLAPQEDIAESSLVSLSKPSKRRK